MKHDALMIVHIRSEYRLHLYLTVHGQPWLCLVQGTLVQNRMHNSSLDSKLDSDHRPKVLSEKKTI